MNLLLYMAPISTLALIPATILLEPGAMDKALQLSRENFGFVLLLVVNSLTAYFVNLTNFLVTKQTSALTLQVRGAHLTVVAGGIPRVGYPNVSLTVSLTVSPSLCLASPPSPPHLVYRSWATPRAWWPPSCPSCCSATP